MRASKDLPPLIALRAFDAVARNLSFRKAAEDLSISQSAVSHHVKQLEADLALALFVRQPRAIYLTPAGADYWAAVSRAFDGIADATRRARTAAAPQKLTVTTVPSFANYWLAPRLQRFIDANPHIELTLKPGLKLLDMDQGAADIAIRYGGGDWTDGASSLLLGERLSPIAAPHRPVTGGIDSLIQHPILIAARGTDLRYWLDAHGPDLPPLKTLQADDYTSVVSLTAAGTALAIGRLHLLAEELRAGRLILPWPHLWVEPSNFGHWIVLPKRDVKPSAPLFADWLREEVRRADAGTGVPEA